MTKPGHEAPLLDNKNSADLTSHAEEPQLRIGQTIPKVEATTEEAKIIDHRDANPQAVTGRDYREVKGMTRRQADRAVTAVVGNKIFQENIRGNEESREVERAQRQAELDAKIMDAIKGDGDPKKTA